MAAGNAVCLVVNVALRCQPLVAVSVERLIKDEAIHCSSRSAVRLT